MVRRRNHLARPRGDGVLRVARRAGIVLLFFVVAAAGTLSGLLFAYGDDIPEITALEEYQPGTITRLLARDGRVVGEFATERRVVVGYDEIAPVLRQAIIATEDGTFERHLGINIPRTISAVFAARNARSRSGCSPCSSRSGSRSEVRRVQAYPARQRDLGTHRRRSSASATSSTWRCAACRTARPSRVLEQEPLVDGALVALENRTGEIRAMVGGYNFAAHRRLPRVSFVDSLARRDPCGTHAA